MPPLLDEARSGAGDMIAASYRIDKILDDIGNLFGKARQEPSPVHVNDLVIEALRIVDKELTIHKVATSVALTSELPPMMGHRGQFQEVVINLIQNAIVAMEVVNDEQRELQVKTERRGGDAINVHYSGHRT
jgi:C4-dicarboxylate-specific signal transduction histidine kinase